MLADNDTQIILLSSYQHFTPESNLAESVEPIIKKAALKDLDSIRNVLVHEYSIPTDRIIYKIVEGDLSAIIEREFKKYPNLAVVMGQSSSNPFKKGSCGNIIKTLIKSSMRPVFLVSEFITVIESERVVLAADKKEDVSNLFTNYLKDIFLPGEIQIKLITRENSNGITLEPKTTIHLAENSNEVKKSNMHPNHLLYDLLVQELTTQETGRCNQ
jgi:hypothetical protein